MGRSEYGPGSKFRTGSNLAQKEITRFSKSCWTNPSRKTVSIGSTSNTTSSLSSTGRKHEGDRRGGTNDRWRGISSEEMEERRAKGLCFKCGGKYHPTQHKCPERSLRVLILGVGLDRSPVIDFSGTMGTPSIAFGAETSYSTSVGKFMKYNAGLCLKMPSSNASVIL